MDGEILMNRDKRWTFQAESLAEGSVSYNIDRTFARNLMKRVMNEYRTG